jgi:hypothetical protein
MNLEESTMNLARYPRPRRRRDRKVGNSWCRVIMIVIVIVELIVELIVVMIIEINEIKTQ